MRAGKFADRFLTIIALIGISMPVFWLGALASYYLGFKWGLFPNGGYVEFGDDPFQWAYHLILPWTVLAVLFVGVYSRILRGNVLDTMNEDFVRTARAKGLSEREIMIRHVLRNSLIPVVTLWGLDFGAVIGGGAILTESVFDLSGRGPVRGRLHQPARCAAGARGHHVRGVLHRPAEHDRGHRLRVSRSTHPPPVSEPLLRVDDLRVSFSTEEGRVVAVDGVSFDLNPGEVLAVVGESGSGKSVTAMTLLGLTRSPNAHFEGTATYKGTELVNATDDELRRVRGAEIAMIFQDPMTSLNPVQRVGSADRGADPGARGPAG